MKKVIVVTSELIGDPYRAITVYEKTMPFLEHVDMIQDQVNEVVSIHRGPYYACIKAKDVEVSIEEQVVQTIEKE